MKLIGFNFTKISIEKTQTTSKDFKISTNIDIPEITEADNEILNKEDKIILARFTYSVSYEPKLAEINISGDLLFMMDKEKAKGILKQWKDKKIPDDFKETLFNLVLRKSNVKALELEEDLKLPFHLPLPKITFEGEKKD